MVPSHDRERKLMFFQIMISKVYSISLLIRATCDKILVLGGGCCKVRIFTETVPQVNAIGCRNTPVHSATLAKSDLHTGASLACSVQASPVKKSLCSGETRLT